MRAFSLFSACVLGAVSSSGLVACERDTVIDSFTTSSGGVGTGGAAGSGGMGGDGGLGPGSFYFEAESGELTPPFVVGTDDAASSGAFVTSTETAAGDAPGAGRARYRFELVEAGEFVLWGRTHGPLPGRSRYFVRFDDEPFVSWRIATGDAWFWDDVHDDVDYGAPRRFSFEAGEHVLEIASAETGAELDRLYLTARGDEPPGNTTPCDPPHSIEENGSCTPSCGSHGATTCGADVCAGRDPLEAFDCDVCCLAP